MLKIAFCVFLGSGLGGVLRFFTSKAFGRFFLSAPAEGMAVLFPWPTLIVNIAGSFLIGLLYGISAKNAVSEEMRILLTTGFCGGLTTFSTFSNESLTLLTEGHFGTGALYIGLSLVLGIAAAWAGHAVVA